MAENSKIEWTDHTFNPWIGCTRVSPACDHCYAEAFVSRWLKQDFNVRRRTSRANWRNIEVLDRKAAAQGSRRRVFCASLADVFDNQVPDEWRSDLWALIRATPNLDWLLLTKRPQNISKMLPVAWGDGWPNVSLGATVENQEEAARRVLHLLSSPAAAYFLSCEPLLGPIDLSRVKVQPDSNETADVLKGWWGGANKGRATRIGQVIVGGESGAGKRPMDLGAARSIRDQCISAGVSFFMKQIDKVQPIPDDLMIRQLP